MSKDAWKSNQWANFHSHDESFLSDGRGKWARVSSSKKSRKRIILNRRRMAFDVEPFHSSSLSANDGKSGKKTRDAIIAQYSEELLTTALSISPGSVEKDVEGFARFLDLTSKLRALPIDLVDFSSKEAFCIFVNIYHCLLQHTLLLDGPPNKVSITNEKYQFITFL